MSVRASDEVRRIVHAFPDQGRRDEVRELAAQVRAVEDERDEWRAYATRMDEARISAQSSLATSTALAAGQAVEIERLKGERDALSDETMKWHHEERPIRTEVRLLKAERDTATAQRDEAVRERDDIQRVLEDLNDDGVEYENDLIAAIRREERERIAALADKRADEHAKQAAEWAMSEHGTMNSAVAGVLRHLAAAIRSNAHNPEPGGD